MTEGAKQNITGNTKRIRAGEMPNPSGEATLQQGKKTGHAEALQHHGITDMLILHVLTA